MTPTYRHRTSAFTEGSHAITDWQEGSKVLFLGPDGGGMVSRIAAHRPDEFLLIEHMGELKDGVEHLGAAWAGVIENYTLEDGGHGCKLRVEMDCPEDHREYMSRTWPLALAKLKSLAES